MMSDREEKLKRAAELFAKQEGESLLAEADALRRQKVSYLTPRADKAVRGLIAKSGRPKRRTALISVCAAAACLMLVFRLAAGLPDERTSSDAAPAMSAASEEPESPEMAGATDAPPGVPDAPPVVPMPAEILPISFALPADYRVRAAEYDNGMSIYALESDQYGDVVLTMYYEEDGAVGTGVDMDEGFGEVIIDGTPVPAKVRDTYMLLAFEKDGLQYTLSSEDNLGALAAFYRNI